LEQSSNFILSRVRAIYGYSVCHPIWFLNINISNGKVRTKLAGTFYDDEGSQIADEFTNQKEIKNKK
jgi:hypothetical protein